MKLTWHIIQKDFARHRLPYGLWLALLLGKLVLLALGFSDRAADSDWLEQYTIGDAVLSVVESIVAFLLVGSWVLEDELVGASQFWVTRPIGGRRLLVAKALGVLLYFVAVPLALAAAGWVACGIGGWALLKLLGVAALGQLALVSAAFVTGAISDRSSRFLLMVLLAFFAFVALVPAIGKLFTVYPESLALQRTRVWVGTGLLVVTVAGVIWWQFTRRRVVWAISALLVGVALGVSAWHVFPWELVRVWERQPLQLAAAESLQLTVREVQIAKHLSPKTPAGQRPIVVTFELSGIPDDLQVDRAYGRLTFFAKDGRRHVAERGMYAVWVTGDEAARRAIGGRPYVFADDAETRAAIDQRRRETAERLTGTASVPPATRIGANDLERLRQPSLDALLTVPDWVAEGLKSGDVGVELVADVRLSRFELRGEFPLEADGSFRGDGFRARITERARYDRSTHLTLSSTRSPLEQRLRFSVVNRELGFVGNMQSESMRMTLPKAQVVRTNFSFRLPQVSRDGQWVDAPGVDRGLALAVLMPVYAGEVRRSARAERVEWRAGK